MLVQSHDIILGGRRRVGGTPGQHHGGGYLHQPSCFFHIVLPCSWVGVTFPTWGYPCGLCKGCRQGGASRESSGQPKGGAAGEASSDPRPASPPLPTVVVGAGKRRNRIGPPFLGCRFPRLLHQSPPVAASFPPPRPGLSAIPGDRPPSRRSGRGSLRRAGPASANPPSAVRPCAAGLPNRGRTRAYPGPPPSGSGRRPVERPHAMRPVPGMRNPRASGRPRRGMCRDVRPVAGSGNSSESR